MAIRGKLHLNHLPKFKEFLYDFGYDDVPMDPGSYQVLKMTNEQMKGPRKTVIVYLKAGAEHLSVQEKDQHLLDLFMKEIKDE